MRNARLLCTCLSCWLLTAGALFTATEQEEGFREIFNGKDLTGWEGDLQRWSVQNGTITGQTSSEAPLSQNQFLIWLGDCPSNFELKMEVRIEGNNNSGIQYRSRRLPELGKHVVGGYQVDIHPNPEYNGMLYEERGRGIIAQHGQKVIIDENGIKWLAGSTGPVLQTDLEVWNEYAVIAEGNRLIHRLNGETTIEVIDHQVERRSLEGILALQIHQGPPMKVQFRNIRLKQLPEGGLLSPASTPIPGDAKKIP